MSENNEYSNPDDFTNSQLFQLLGLNYDSDGEDEYGNMVTPQIIKSTSEQRIKQFQNAGNEDLENFFMMTENKLLQDYKTDWNDNDMFNQYHDPYEESEEEDNMENNEDDDNDVNSEEDNMEEINQIQDETNEQDKIEDDEEEEDSSIEGFGVDQPNSIQQNKITDRYDQTNVLDGDHPVMERNTLGVSNTKNIPISQGTLNPSLRNTKTQIVNINSIYRDNIFPPSTSGASSTNFTINLSDPLYKVLDMKLSTYTIPYTWYNVNDSNNYFYIDSYDASSTPNYTSLGKFIVPVGNYNTTSLFTAIGNVSSPAIDLSITNVDSTGKTSITLTSTTAYRIRFYEQTSDFSQSKFNNNLGWLLGFRGNTDDTSDNYGKMIYQVDNDGLLSESIVDVHGPRHFTLCVDDFCNTQMSNHVVGTTPTDNNVQIPSYWNSDLNIECEDNKVLSYVRELPRKLTNAQLYTMNTITANDQASLPSYSANSSSRLANPTYTNALSVLPIDTSSLTFGSTIMKEAKTSMPRVYFGPVSIDRLRVRLLDEFGNQVEMNNRDWSFTLQVTSLYQY